ncbi:MAG: S24 family peptidase [Thermomicrobiales bacterium]
MFVRLPIPHTSMMASYHHLMTMSRDVTTTSYDVIMKERVLTFGPWLAGEIDKRDWQQADLARRLDVKPGVVSSWINEKRRPSYESCLEIGEALGIDPEIVLRQAGRETTRQVQERPRSLADELAALSRRMPRMIPHYSQIVSAGRGEPVIDSYLYLSPDEHVGPNEFAVDVTGDCMDPLISPGDTVMVNPDLAPESGKLVVFEIDHEKTMVKRLEWHEGKRWLVPLHGARVPFDEHVRPVGVVTKIIKHV